jgi:hypothetical protein
VRRFVLLACALLVCRADTRAQPSVDLARSLSALAERTQQYYDRFISIICTETVRTQELRANLSPAGRPRTTVNELSVSRDARSTGESQFRVERMLQSVNGRPARPNQRTECTDPKTGTPEPLAFLLAANQAKYRFTAADSGFPRSHALDFVETPPASVRVKWEGHCFEADGGGQQGRIWFDADTFDVIQLEVRLSKPFLIPMPHGSFGLRLPIRVERSEMTLRFARVEFEEPDEALMLPASIETLHVLRGVPSIRISQTLANYRRFLTRSEIRN